MVDHPQFLGIPTGTPISGRRKKSNFNIKDIWRTYLSILARWCNIKRSSPKAIDKSQLEPNFEEEDLEEFGDDIEEEKSMNGVHSFRYNPDSIQGDSPSSPRGFYKHKSMDNYFHNIPSPISRSASRRTPSPTPSFLQRNISKRSTDSNYGFSESLSRSTSRASTTPIMFSNSNGMMKPPAIQKNLECTLEELCYGCKKKIKVTRDVLSNTGQIIQEEELLTIKVKPGWKKGTKITFEGMGNEKPGTCPADITFVIAEKRHHLFRREGDDLEIAVEIPLLKALTGCEISIPLLGGEKMTLIINDIIYPGYEKIITGQGMPNTKERGKRGNLKVVFLVEFPTELSDDQRSDIVNILEDSC